MRPKKRRPGWKSVLHRPSLRRPCCRRHRSAQARPQPARRGRGPAPAARGAPAAVIRAPAAVAAAAPPAPVAARAKPLARDLDSELLDVFLEEVREVVVNGLIAIDL